MQVKRSNILRHFRGRRLIPLLAAAGIMFVALGGYKGITSFAMDEMTGVLGGTGSAGDEDLLAQAGSPKAAPAAKAEPARQVVTPKERTAERQASKAVVAVVAQAQSGRQPAPAQPSPRLASQSAPAPQTAGGDSVAVRKIMEVYTASFLRDPFYSLIQAGKDRPTKLLDLARAKMVGSVWGESGIIALLEDDTGRSYALKVGDRVTNGRVIAVTPASITFSITTFGLTKTVTLELAEEGE